MMVTNIKMKLNRILEVVEESYLAAVRLIVQIVDAHIVIFQNEVMELMEDEERIIPIKPEEVLLSKEIPLLKFVVR